MLNELGKCMSCNFLLINRHAASQRRSVTSGVHFGAWWPDAVDSSVGRAEDCSAQAVILRSLVQIRLDGNFLRFFPSFQSLFIGIHSQRIDSRRLEGYFKIGWFPLRLVLLKTSRCRQVNPLPAIVSLSDFRAKKYESGRRESFQNDVSLPLGLKPIPGTSSLRESIFFLELSAEGDKTYSRDAIAVKRGCSSDGRALA